MSLQTTRRRLFLFDMENEIEIWKDVEGWEGFYQVSNMGRIKSINRIIVRNDKKPLPRKEMILKPAKNRGGYRIIGLRKCGKNRTCTVHRLVALHFIPNPSNLPEVNHKWGDKDDNRACALEWMTSGQNSQHAYDTGLNVAARGEKQGSSKLKEIDVIQIKNMLKISNDQIAISKKYGVTSSTISRIKRGIVWAWLE